MQHAQIRAIVECAFCAGRALFFRGWMGKRICVTFLSAAVPALRWRGGFSVRRPVAASRVTLPLLQALNLVVPEKWPPLDGRAAVLGGAVEVVSVASPVTFGNVLAVSKNTT